MDIVSGLIRKTMQLSQSQRAYKILNEIGKFIIIIKSWYALKEGSGVPWPFREEMSKPHCL